jgi:hypothetical protein
MVVGLLPMKTLRPAIVCSCIAIFCSCADHRDEAKRRVQEAKNAVSEYAQKAVRESESSILEVKRKIEVLIPAIETKDLDRLKSACTELDVLLDTDVLGVYYRVFALEVESGPAVAKLFLADKLSDSALSDRQKRPLQALKVYFDAKGTISTKDAALTVLAIVLEAKFPHGRAAGLVVVFMDDPGGISDEKQPQSN